ncbi:acetyltransferase [Belnapia sp. F-4-1]|uniref:acetyltransferase n=1 Tax=Belnapia sp. F-4-1 TaxID=1545443 RepID=UPI0005BCBEA0|nr:acetyltransferase [Belnapia sp. F-4-1]
MRDLVIFGAGDIAALAAFYFTEDARRRVVAFTVDAAFRQGDTFLDQPLVAFEEVATLYPPDRYELFVALSYSKLNRIRSEKCAAARGLGYTLPSYVSSCASVFGDLSHGDNCFILEDNTIQPYARIGRNVTLWSGNHIGHHSVIEDDVFVASHVVISGGVRIGEGCFIGVNATLRDHITLGPRCVVGAGALLLADAEPEGVYMGTATERARIPSSRLRGI